MNLELIFTGVSCIATVLALIVAIWALIVTNRKSNKKENLRKSGDTKQSAQHEKIEESKE